MNEIYYLLEFHKKCCRIACYGDTIISNYCNFVNTILNDNFTIQEQKQLKLYNFNSDLLYKFAYDDVNDITFNDLDKDKLFTLFEKICYINEDELQ
jgi:hypothetical protein